MKTTTDSEKILRSQISGIQRIVNLRIIIDGKRISHFKNFKLNQSVRTHHQFELILDHDIFQERQNHELEEVQKFLGKRITIIFKYKDLIDDSPERSFIGVITKVAFSQAQNSLGDIVIKGQSPTILLDGAPHFQSFGGDSTVNSAIIANDIFKQALGTNKYTYKVNPKIKNHIIYSAQYNETHYNYIVRLAEAYGEQFFYDGEIPKNVHPLQLVYGANVCDIVVELKALHTNPQFFSYNSKNNEKITTSTQHIRHLGDLARKAYSLNDNIFSTQSLQPSPIIVNMFKDLDDSQKGTLGSIAAEVLTVSGTTTIPFLYPGCIAHIEMRKIDSNKTSYFTRLMITEITHEVDARGYYKGTFEAIAEGTGYLPKTEFTIPKAEPQLATVVSNNDPLKQGRVQVKFNWQLHDTTNFIRVMSPDAGGTGNVTKNRGYVAIPEVGDQVMVGFEFQNPSMPFVMGGMFHGINGIGGGLDNHIKSIQTKSGNKVIFNDKEGSIFIEDPSGNTYKMDGKGNIEVSAPNKIIMSATDIQMNAYNNLEVNASNNVIINAMSKFFVFTPYIKQVVSGLMSFFSGKALLSSSNSIDIEAKEAKLHGTNKTTIHSDKQAIINSKGTAEIYGESGNQLSNKAQDTSSTPTETIAIAMAYFRPKDTWNGEFGFDWLREKDNGLALSTDPAYKDIIESGYKDGVTDLTSTEAYERLKTQYTKIPITRKPLEEGAPAPAEAPSTEYFVPYLTLFSKEFVDTLPETVSNKPKYEAELKVLVEIEDDIDKLEFDLNSINTNSNNPLITIDKVTLEHKNRTNGLVNATDATIKITCHKDLDSDKAINIYAYPKDSTTKTPAEQLVERKLAGKITILKNDANTRKNQKFVLIPVLTDINNTGIITGIFEPSELKKLQEVLYHSIVTSELEIGPALNLSNDDKFKLTIDDEGNKTYGEFIYQNTTDNIEETDGNIHQDHSNIFDYVKQLYLEQKPRVYYRLLYHVFF